MKFRVGDKYIYQFPTQPSEIATIVKIDHDYILFHYARQDGSSEEAFDYYQEVCKYYHKIKPTHTKLGKVLYK